MLGQDHVTFKLPVLVLVHLPLISSQVERGYTGVVFCLRSRQCLKFGFQHGLDVVVQEFEEWVRRVRGRLWSRR